MWITLIIFSLTSFLSFSRAGVQNGERARIRIEPLVMRILEEEKAWDVAPGVKVQVVQDLPDVSLHEVRAYEVFSNLISNCLKFRHPDRALRIVVGFKSDDGELIPSDPFRTCAAVCAGQRERNRKGIPAQGF